MNFPLQLFVKKLVESQMIQCILVFRRHSTGEVREPHVISLASLTMSSIIMTVRYSYTCPRLVVAQKSVEVCCCWLTGSDPLIRPSLKKPLTRPSQGLSTGLAYGERLIEDRLLQASAISVSTILTGANGPKHGCNWSCVNYHSRKTPSVAFRAAEIWLGRG